MVMNTSASASSEVVTSRESAKAPSSGAPRPRAALSRVVAGGNGRRPEGDGGVLLMCFQGDAAPGEQPHVHSEQQPQVSGEQAGQVAVARPTGKVFDDQRAAGRP